MIKFARRRILKPFEGNQLARKLDNTAVYNIDDGGGVTGWWSDEVAAFWIFYLID